MTLFKRTTKFLIIRIDEFFDNVELGILVFREGIKSYIQKNQEDFIRHLQKIDVLESNADNLQRVIENDMITNSILPQHREEITRLIDELDEIIDAVKSSLNDFNIELPEIPDSISERIVSLAESSANAAEELIPAARAYFRSPYSVRDKILKVYYFETETDTISKGIKKHIFQEMPELDLAHKAHLRYILHNIEKISDIAQKAADLLAAMAIKVIV